MIKISADGVQRKDGFCFFGLNLILSNQPNDKKRIFKIVNINMWGMKSIFSILKKKNVYPELRTVVSLSSN